MATQRTDGQNTEGTGAVQLVRAHARAAGWWYLGVAVTGLVSFGVLRGQLYVAGDPAATLVAMRSHVVAARLLVLAELGLVATQAMTAWAFWRLFRPLDPASGAAVGFFGVANSSVILISTACLTTALRLTGDGAWQPEALADTVQVLFEVSGAAWSVGSVFFGLWLLPMGWFALGTRTLPRGLGVMLLVSGACYLVNLALGLGTTLPKSIIDLLLIPPTFTEFWVIGALLFKKFEPVRAA